MQNVTNTAAALVLSHRQEIRVKGFTKLASKITVGTCRGYSKQYSPSDEVAEDAHKSALEKGHQTAWANQAASVLMSDFPGKREMLDAAAAATAAAPEIEDGQEVEIEGEIFRVRVLGQRYSDPVHFVRVA